jgi:hypothetical protein
VSSVISSQSEACSQTELCAYDSAKRATGIGDERVETDQQGFCFTALHTGKTKDSKVLKQLAKNESFRCKVGGAVEKEA